MNQTRPRPFPPPSVTEGYVLFGDATEGDVLKNLTINFVKRLVGRHVAVVLINGIVLCNTFNLLVNFVLKVRLPGPWN